MSFYDHLSFYLDNSAFHPGTGDAHRKRNVRYAAKKYFTKGLLPILAGTIVCLGYANGILCL